jgi:hypothetical protein
MSGGPRKTAKRERSAFEEGENGQTANGCAFFGISQTSLHFGPWATSYGAAKHGWDIQFRPDKDTQGPKFNRKAKTPVFD